MRRSVFALLVLLGALVISVVSPLVYDRYVEDNCLTTGDTKDSVTVHMAVAQVLNPQFTDVQDVLQHQEEVKNDAFVDSVYIHIPKDALYNISRVVIGRAGSATKRSIVHEYIANYNNVYKYIKEKVPLTRGDTIKLPPSSSTDTIIDGKHFKLIKETKNEQD